MIEVLKLQKKVDELEVYLDLIEKHCDDLKFGSYCEPDSIVRRSMLEKRKGLVTILLMFRPKSKVLNEYEKAMESLWH